MRHQVISLRSVPEVTGSEWMTLASARAEGVDLSWVADGIGPRERGTVYYGAYWGTVNTVHQVFVKVVAVGRDSVTGQPRPRRATYWEIVEQSQRDNGRTRRHCTSWEYDRRNQPLFMISE